MFDNIFIAPTARQECMRRDFAIFCPRKLQRVSVALSDRNQTFLSESSINHFIKKQYYQLIVLYPLRRSGGGLYSITD